MSRKQTLAAQKLLVEQAIYQKQSVGWIRSLQRNDSDIAAVVALNRSLHVVKNAFINTYNNELLLLHIGQGKYRLSPDGSDRLVKPVLETPQPPPGSKSPSPLKGGTPVNGAPKSSSNSCRLQYQSVSHGEITVEQQELCVDFLLRKKLRRKLISRIIRRLQRIATSMDHLEQMTIPSSTSAALNPNLITDIVAPSGPPKYGDLRLYCDPKAVEEFAQVQQKKVQAWQHIIATRENEEYRRIDNDSGGGKGKVSSTSPLPSPKRHIIKNSGSPANHQTTTTVPEETPAVKAAAEDVKDNLKEEETLHPTEKPQPSDNTLEEGKVSQVVLESVNIKVDQPEGNLIDTIVAPAVSSISNATPAAVPSEVTSDAAAPSTTDVASDDPIPTATEDHPDLLAADYELFLDYKDAYEKLISSVIPIEEGLALPDSNDVSSYLQRLPPGTLNINYTTLQDEREKDYMIIKNGIGATHPNMTLQEREAEYLKWESNLLSRIPEQPTYEELGFENRVFFYEERLQRAMHKRRGQLKEGQTELEDEEHMDVDAEKVAGTNEKESDTLNENEDDANKEDMDVVVDEDAVAGDIKNLAVNNEEEPATEGNNMDETEKDIDKVEPKPLRPISLVAIPSFYEQDLKRIKLVQAELLAISKQEHATQRLEDATREFNQCLHNSMELANQRTYLQNQVNQLSQQIRALTQSVQSDYMVHVTLAKNRWNLDRCSFETSKLNKVLPSRNGIMPSGSMMTQSYKSRPDRIAVGLNEIVANCIADVVDCVDNIGSGHVRNERFQDPFVLPPPSADVEALHHAKQLETTKRNDLNTCTLQLRTSEGERLRAWRKMLKTKMEFNIPHQHYSGSGQMRLIHLNQSLCATMQLPALHLTAAQDIPQELPGRSSVATYTPMHTVRTQPSQIPTSESKYSTARVRERIASDGTVAPVTKPKMTADGLYSRPAGRTRKGMEWDAVRGIWIPASEAAMQLS